MSHPFSSEERHCKLCHHLPPPPAPIVLDKLRLRLTQQQKPATGYDPIRYSPKITTPTDQRSYLGISCRTACIQNTNLDSQPPAYYRKITLSKYIHHLQIITNNEERTSKSKSTLYVPHALYHSEHYCTTRWHFVHPYTVFTGVFDTEMECFL
jgi:hypothetical protein